MAPSLGIVQVIDRQVLKLIDFFSLKVGWEVLKRSVYRQVRIFSGHFLILLTSGLQRWGNIPLRFGNLLLEHPLFFGHFGRLVEFFSFGGVARICIHRKVERLESLPSSLEQRIQELTVSPNCTQMHPIYK